MGKKEPKSNKVILAVTYLGRPCFWGWLGIWDIFSRYRGRP